MDFSNIDEKINQSKSKIGNIKAQLEYETEKLKKLNLEKVRLHYGIEIGGIVIVKIRGMNREVKITEIESWNSGKPWIKGNFQKANKKFSTQIRNFYSDWELKV